MERWTGRVALVTGASAGIGLAICEALVKVGFKVVGCARNADSIKDLGNTLQGESGSLFSVKCDLTKDGEVYALFKIIEKRYGGVDICINNAGMSYDKSLLEGTPEQWRCMMDINVIALCLCTKLAVASMRERGVDDGQIINISSLAGHINPNVSAIHFYTATKASVIALTEGLRQELREAKSHIRASSISPGRVATEFFHRMHQDSAEKAGNYCSKFLTLQAEDIASSVLHIISSPPHVEINDMLIRSTEQMH